MTLTSITSACCVGTAALTLALAGSWPSNALAAEQPAPPSLAALESRLSKPGDPDASEKNLAITAELQRLVESGALTSCEEFFRAAQLVGLCDSAFRAARTRYELLLAASALGHSAAKPLLARAWDDLMDALGRPRRFHPADRPDHDTEPAAGCMADVLRDPAAALAKASGAQANPEMKQIRDADQADRQANDLDWSIVDARDIARAKRTHEIIRAGELRTASDFSAASLVLQHSGHFAGYRTAHELAVCALLLGSKPRLAAMTYDRMLNSIGHDQRFGTQYLGFGNGPTRLQPVDTRGLCDAQRLALGCGPITKAQAATSTASPQ